MYRKDLDQKSCSVLRISCDFFISIYKTLLSHDLLAIRTLSKENIYCHIKHASEIYSNIIFIIFYKKAVRNLKIILENVYCSFLLDKEAMKWNAKLKIGKGY